MGWATALVAGLSAAALGCDLPIEAAPRSGPEVLGTDPADGDSDVDRAADIGIYFDRLVFPSDVHRGHVLVVSGTRSALVSPRFDPVERALVIENIGAPLDPAVRYRVRVEGLHDLDGAEMAPHEILFTTGERAEGEVARPPLGFADVAPIFSERCATAACHAAEAPALGLDLSSGPAVAATAIGVIAEQSRTGAQGDDPWPSAPTLSGLARIDVTAGVGRPSRSFLLYKVLGDPHVAGERMPPSPAEGLSATELSTLSRWILDGASTH